MGKKIIRYGLLGVAICGVLSLMLVTQNIFAATSVQGVKDKFIRRGFTVCYNSYFVDSFSDNTLDEDLNSRQDLISKTNGNRNRTIVASPPETVMTCKELMDKLGKPEVASPLTHSDRVNILESLGYSAKSSVGAGTTKTYEFKFDGYDAATDKTTDNSASIKMIVKNEGQKSQELKIEGANGNASGLTGNDTLTGINLIIDGNNKVSVYSGAAVYGNVIGSASGTASEIASQINSILARNMKMGSCGNYCVTGWTYSGMKAGDNAKTVASYKKPGSGSEGFKKAYKLMFGEDYSKDSIHISTDEAVALYQDYLVNYYSANKEGCVGSKNELQKDGRGESWYRTAIYGDDGNVQYCYVQAGNNQNNTVYGVQKSGSGWMPSLGSDSKIGFGDVAKWLYDNGPDKIDAELAASTTNGGENGGEDEGEEQDLCFNTADAIGWILCPIIKTTSGALDGAYDEFIKPLLQVSPQVVQALTLDNSSGIYQAWAIFRDIANVVFVILFLVVIFSQVTGYGIDNYGIKRMLPRLIVGAILVNFSFLICQLVVDMSNIVGASLQELLMSVGRGITIEGGDSSSIGGLFSIVLGAIGVGAAAAGAVIVATSVLPALSLGSLLSIAITIISALVAIFFGMVLLGARQAIIVLLVVTSPVAFVLYLLPNTQAYFRRWTGIFSRLLLVYPAAGLLIGGGYLAAKILLSVNGGFIMNLVGLVMLVIPYFLIIPLVRTSMNAIAGLGGRLQAYGRGTSRTVKDVRKTDGYRSLDAKLRGRSMQKRIDRMAGVREKRRGVLSGFPSRFGRVGRAIGKAGGAIAGMVDMAENERMINEANLVENEEDRRLKGEASVYGLRNPGATSAKMWQDFKNVEGDDADAIRQRKAILMAMEQNGYSKDIIKNAQSRLMEGKGKFEKNGEMIALADHLGKNGRTMEMLKDEDPEIAKYIAMRNNDGIYEEDNDGRLHTNEEGNLRTKAKYMEDNPRVEDITRLSESGIKRGLATGRITMDDLQNTLGPNAPDSIRSRWKSNQRQIAEDYMKADNDSKSDIVRQYVTEIDSGKKDDRKMEALTYANGGNVTGQSGVVYGIRPYASKMGGTFNSDKAFRTNDGKTVLMDSSRNIAWNATDGVQMNGDELSTAQGNIKTDYT